MKVNLAMKVLQRVGFFVLAGAESADLDGEEVLVRLPEFEKMKVLRSSDLVPLVMKFVNWGRAPKDILQFTRLYGPLQSPPEFAQEFRFSLDQWRGSQTRFRASWDKFPGGSWEKIFIGGLSSPPSYSWRYRGKELEYQAGSLGEFLWLTFFSLPRERLRKCSRPGCTTAFFIAEHLNQRCCSDGCKRWVQRQSKQKWWAKHGQAWRQTRQKSFKRKTTSRGGKR